jgi:hypothetical protein
LPGIGIGQHFRDACDDAIARTRMIFAHEAQAARRDRPSEPAMAIVGNDLKQRPHSRFADFAENMRQVLRHPVVELFEATQQFDQRFDRCFGLEIGQCPPGRDGK